MLWTMFFSVHAENINDSTAYLFVFHQDPTSSLYMATSRDGYTFTALNHGRPVMAGDTLATQHGIRDPHIYRGPDGAFYLSGFKRDFFEIFGRTPHQWIVDKRLEYAKELIESNACPLSEVYLKAGFKNPTHFSTIFRKRYGMTPSEAFPK